MNARQLKTCCAISLLAAGLTLPARSAGNANAKKTEHKITCPACKAMGSKLSAGDQKIIDHMKASASAADRKTFDAMSPAEKALVMKAVKATFLHGKMSGKSGKK